MDERILFESRNLRARQVAGRDRALLVVTFSSYIKGGGRDRPGFGEDFLRDEGLAAIHVTAATNRWFQYAELPDMLAAIRGAAGAYARVLTYGSSMGGFAALTYGAECGADTGIAFSPQVSLDRAVAPFETRWRAEARRIRRWHVPRQRLARQIIAYDPRHAIDAAHVAAFAAVAPTIKIEVPHGGHPVGAALSQADLLKPLIRDVAAGTFDPAQYQQVLRARRRHSGQYLYTLARRLGPHHAATRLALAGRARAIDPSPHTQVLVAQCLAALGRAGEAEAAYRSAIERAPEDVDALVAFAGHLEAGGRPVEATPLMRRARRLAPDAPALRRAALRLFLRRRFGFLRRLF